MTKPGPKPKRTSSPRWTPELAYACGLIATDGSLSVDGRHINLTSKDVEQLETFMNCLGIKIKISWKKSGFSKILHSQVQFSDVTLYKWLLSIGITPRKTFTISAIKVPDRYFFDYLRGEFDGDGSSHAYWDTRWHSSVSMYVQFVSASHKHSKWLRDTVYRMANANGVIGVSRRLFQLKYAKTQAQIVYDRMYHHDLIPCLKRKKEKLDRQWIALKLSRQGIQPEGFKRGGPVICIT